MPTRQTARAGDAGVEGTVLEAHMRRYFPIWATVLVAALMLFGIAPAAFAQDGGAEPEDKPKEGDPAKETPKEEAPKDEAKEPPAFQLSEKDQKKVEKALAKYLIPTKKGERDSKAIDKVADKKFDGHSALEDVTALAAMANRARVFGSKVGRKGAIVAVKVPPAVHGFPGGVGTVNYWLYLPKRYSDKKLWPVVFAMPNTKQYPDTSRYLKEVWLKNSAAIRDGFIVAVPTPSAKGKQWRTDAKSYARAMIALRHVVGTFDGGRKTAGPASDYTRVFVDGGDVAALLGARFSELFAGVILRGADGFAGSVKMRKDGHLNGLPAYCVIEPKKKNQSKFAGLLKTDNEASVVVESADPNAADTEAMAKWMSELPARVQPRSIRYTLHDGSFQRHHWINVLRFDSSLQPPASFSATCDRINNVVTIECRGLTRFEVSLNDALVDLSRDVTIKVVEDEKELIAYEGRAPRDMGRMLAELLDSNQPWRIYPVRISIDLPTLRERAAEAEAVAAAKAAAEKETEKKGASVGVTGGSLDR